MAETDIWSCPECHKYYRPGRRVWEFRDDRSRYKNTSCPYCMRTKLKRYGKLYMHIVDAAGHRVGADIHAGSRSPLDDHELVNAIMVLYSKARLYDQMAAAKYQPIKE